MHWLCFPVRLFNIEMRALETGKAISRSELGLFRRTAPASLRDRELVSIGTCSSHAPRFTGGVADYFCLIKDRNIVMLGLISLAIEDQKRGDLLSYMVH
jgi:hypothetical protein